MQRVLALLAVVAFTFACHESTNTNGQTSLGAAFQSVPVGFTDAQHSFAGSAPGADPEWSPRNDAGPAIGDLADPWAVIAMTVTIPIMMVVPASGDSWAAGWAASSSAPDSAPALATGAGSPP